MLTSEVGFVLEERFKKEGHAAVHEGLPAYLSMDCGSHLPPANTSCLLG